MTVYLDCAATTPIDPRVKSVVDRFVSQEFGNAGSRTHDFGTRARRAVEEARGRVAEVVAAGRGEVIFTSGATESNNLAILGLAEHGHESARRHIVSTALEHHAVLDPLRVLSCRGFEVTLVAPTPGGWVEPGALMEAMRPQTLLVSLMHVNNETGVIQPVREVADAMVKRWPGDEERPYLHVDAAQGFAKDVASLRHGQIDLISVSGHKIHAPKGVGGLITRRRNRRRPPLKPLMFGGGQERELRPGTLPVHLIVGLGKAAQLALAEADLRARTCRRLRQRLLAALSPLGVRLNGDPQRTVPHILNISFPGLDAESVIEAWQDLVAISHGAACTSQAYGCSHVLGAMGLDRRRIDEALRLSWCHMTRTPELDTMVAAIVRLQEESSSRGGP